MSTDEKMKRTVRRLDKKKWDEYLDDLSANIQETQIKLDILKRIMNQAIEEYEEKFNVRCPIRDSRKR